MMTKYGIICVINIKKYIYSQLAYDNDVGWKFDGNDITPTND